MLTLQKDKLAVSVSQSLVSEDGDASIKIPPFYFPHGRPTTNTDEPDATLKLAREYLKKFPEEKLKQEDMHGFAKVVYTNLYDGMMGISECLLQLTDQFSKLSDLAMPSSCPTKMRNVKYGIKFKFYRA